MKRAMAYLRTMDRRSLLWVALAFGLTSVVYLAWLDRLVTLAGAAASDALSLVAGYLFQAVGLAVACAFFKRNRPSLEGEADAAARHRQAFILTVVLFAVATVPALLTESIPAVIAFGLLMNLLCGVIAGFYLWTVGARVDARQRSMVFGGGYAVATVGAGLLAIAGLTRGWTAVPVCLALSAALLWATLRFDCMRLSGSLRAVGEARPGQETTPDIPDGKGMPLLTLACVAVLLISVVKDLGFNFPSADIQAGLVPEIARIPYAVGLLAAGFINDRNRKHGLVCAAATLVIPFIMLALIDKPISSAIFWGLNYVFYAFFTVFRVVIVMDIVSREGRDAAPRYWLAPLGLLVGRIGDAVGSGIALTLSGRLIPLIITAGGLFAACVFALYRLYERCFMPEAVRQRTEKEIFNAFCMHNDLSTREQEVLQMLLARQTNAQIGDALFISENTVKYHVKNILQKTGCKNRGDLQAKYMQAAYPTGATVLPFKMPDAR